MDVYIFGSLASAQVKQPRESGRVAVYMTTPGRTQRTANSSRLGMAAASNGKNRRRLRYQHSILTTGVDE